jgi:hypothetical protein
MPITTMIDRIVNHGAAAADELNALLAQPFGVERAVVPWLRRTATRAVD